MVAYDFLILPHLRDFLRIAVIGNLHAEDRASRRNFDWLFC